MKLNREQIIKALECCTNCICNHAKTDTECPLVKMDFCKNYLMKQSLALIKEQDEQIFKLENRLKECENGYEGTLSLDRCKLHDAEEKVKELTQLHEMLSESYDHLEKTKDELIAERARLTEENERLNKEVADLQDELKCEKETNAHLCSQYMSENHLRHQVEEMLANGMSVVKANTVRKMQERFNEKVAKLLISPSIQYQASAFIDQIAKEMVEGSECGG